MSQLRVFICHAVQDKPEIRKLYARLKQEPWLAPWFDEENLLPGQDWDMEITKTLRATDVIIICLSNVSIKKEGYIQKEIKRAFDIAEEKPEGAIYIIPLRLDDCEIPPRLKKLHWVDYFSPNYDQKLLNAFKARAASLGLQTESAPPKTSPPELKPQNYTPGGQPMYTFAGMDFVKVPAGDFFMGSDDGEEDEKPQHLVYQLDYDYFIGRYPITNQDWLKYARELGKPNTMMPNKLRHPAIDITWYDAQDYIKLLNQKFMAELPSGLKFRLPSEAEWEKAARGEQGNIYPWGNSFDKRNCNSTESGIGTTTPVGQFSPQGDSPYGCADMAGNVWEWTRNISDFSYPYDLYGGCENENASNKFARVLRGGSFNYNGWYSRSTFHRKSNPLHRYGLSGFRVALTILHKSY